jgi:hypothetical protein
MNIGHVQNGTNAGWRRLHAPHEAWDCPACERHNAKHLNQCLSCGQRRA